MNYNNHLKLTTKESFSSESSENEDSDDNLNFFNSKKKKDVSTIEIYDSNGLPMQEKPKKQVVTLIFEDPVRKFIEIKAK